jgi:hypothetical protein
MTITQDLPIKPRYLGGAETESERRFHETLESVKDLIPVRAYMDLSDTAGERVWRSYDYGVGVGLGQLVRDDGDGMGRHAAISMVRTALDRIGQFVDQIAEMP